MIRLSDRAIMDKGSVGVKGRNEIVLSFSWSKKKLGEVKLPPVKMCLEASARLTDYQPSLVASAGMLSR
jgi:hypothetical protein